jgi:hypothetical protein
MAENSKDDQKPAQQAAQPAAIVVAPDSGKPTKETILESFSGFQLARLELQTIHPNLYKAVVSIIGILWFLFNAWIGALVGAIWPEINWGWFVIIILCVFITVVVFVLYWSDFKLAQKNGFQLFTGSWIVAWLSFIGAAIISFHSTKQHVSFDKKLIDTTNYYTKKIDFINTNQIPGLLNELDYYSNNLALDDRFKVVDQRHYLLKYWGISEFHNGHYSDSLALLEMSDEAYEKDVTTAHAGSWRAINWPYEAADHLMSKDMPESTVNVLTFSNELVEDLKKYHYREDLVNVGRIDDYLVDTRNYLPKYTWPSIDFIRTNKIPLYLTNSMDNP